MSRDALLTTTTETQYGITEFEVLVEVLAFKIQ
jgi:hypothetical protein